MIELGGGGQSPDKHLEDGDAGFVMEHFARIRCAVIFGGHYSRLRGMEANISRRYLFASALRQALSVRQVIRAWSRTSPRAQ
jgi:hypothetical protein